MGAGAVIECGDVAGRQYDSAVEVLQRLFWEAERKQQVAAIVVGRRILGKELHRLVEVFDRRFGLTKANVGHGAVVENGGFAVVGQRVVLQRIRVGADSLAGIAPYQGRRGFLHLGLRTFLRICRRSHNHRQHHGGGEAWGRGFRALAHRPHRQEAVPKSTRHCRPHRATDWSAR